MKVHLLKLGIQPFDTTIYYSLPLESPQNVALLSSLLSLQLYPWIGLSPSRERQDSVFDDDWAFFSNFSRHALGGRA